MKYAWLAFAMIVGWLGTAAADDPPPAQDPPQAATSLAGRITDVLGKPIPSARLYVLPQGGGLRLQAETDKDGRYSVVVPGGAHAVVIAVGKVHTFRQVIATEHKVTTLDIEVEIDVAAGGEVIRIIDRQLPPPAVPPKPQVDQRISLPYSDQAVERDAWARAWLLLDVDTTGTVTRLKLLKPPGFDLDQIAIDEGFKLRFEPALDAAGRPVRTYVVWTMEWPSWGWLVTGNGTAAGRPNDHDLVRPETRDPRGVGAPPPTSPTTTSADDSGGVGLSPNEANTAQRVSGIIAPFARPMLLASQKALSSVPCAGSGPLNLDLRNRAYRDCSAAPDPKTADALPWITRENAKTALAELARTQPRYVKKPRGSRIPEITATAITGAMLVGAIYSYTRWDHYFDIVSRSRIAGDPKREDNGAQMNRYKTLTLGLVGGVVIGGAVTAFLWSRGQEYESFSVQPTRGGGTVSYGGSF